MRNWWERWLSEEHWLLLQRTWVWFPAPTWWFITIYNSSFRDSSSGLRRHQGCTHICRKNTYTHKTKDKKIIENYKQNYHMIWYMPQRLRALLVLPEDQHLIPNTHIRLFTTTCKTSPRRVWHLSSLWEHTHTHTHTHTHIYTYWKVIKMTSVGKLWVELQFRMLTEINCIQISTVFSLMCGALI